MMVMCTHLTPGDRSGANFYENRSNYTKRWGQLLL
jgi:hypothetical protein